MWKPRRCWSGELERMLRGKEADMLVWQGKEYRRIILVGSPGSGKSWLSGKLAEVSGYPLTHLDNEFWQPGWKETPREEWIARQKELMAGDTWIIDGNYGATLELRFQEADLILFLDVGRLVCVWSVVARHGKKRPDLPEYLEERFDRDFLEFLIDTWLFSKKHRKRILALHGKYPEKTFLRLRSRREARRFAEEAGKGTPERDCYG